MPLTVDTQLIVFDSSRTQGKPMTVKDVSYGKYLQQMKQVAQLTQLKPENFFMSHHPLLAVAPVNSIVPLPRGTMTLAASRAVRKPAKAVISQTLR